jgi:hypothetical protein
MGKVLKLCFFCFLETADALFDIAKNVGAIVKIDLTESDKYVELSPVQDFVNINLPVTL